MGKAIGRLHKSFNQVLRKIGRRKLKISVILRSTFLCLHIEFQVSYGYIVRLSVLYMYICVYIHMIFTNICILHMCIHILIGIEKYRW